MKCLHLFRWVNATGLQKVQKHVRLQLSLGVSGGRVGRKNEEWEQTRVGGWRGGGCGGDAGAELETPKRTPVEIRVGTRPTPTRVAAAPPWNNGSKREKEGGKFECTTSPFSVCLCVCLYVCVWCCILISTLKRIGQRKGGEERERSVGSLEKVYSSFLWSQTGEKVLFVFWL